jgi:hypothetical protein
MASTFYTQDRLSYLEKAASFVAAVANSADKNSADKNSGSNNVSYSNKIREPIKTSQIAGTSDRYGALNRSAEVDSLLKNGGSEGNDESSNSSFFPKDNRKSSSTTEKPSSTRHQNTKKKDKKKRKALAASSESSDGAISFGKTSIGELHMNPKKQKLQDDESDEEDGEHDLTTPEGQMAMNAMLTAKAASTEAKREYNRRNAARARKRNKFMVGGLQEKIHSLTKRTEDLQRSNDVLQAQLEVLQTQNQDLLARCQDTKPKAKMKSSPSNDIMSQLLEELQGKSEAQQQVQAITQLLNSLKGQGSSSELFSSLQGGQHAEGNRLVGVPDQGNSQLLSALLGQAQQQLPRQEQNTNLQTGRQGPSISQLITTFGIQGKQQQRGQQQVSGATQDQQHLQQLLSSLSPEPLYNMLRESSRG